MIDKCINLHKHINSMAKTSQHQLKGIYGIAPFTPVRTLVFYRVNYAYSIFTGTAQYPPSSLKAVLNAAV